MNLFHAGDYRNVVDRQYTAGMELASQRNTDLTIMNGEQWPFMTAYPSECKKMKKIVHDLSSFFFFLRVYLSLRVSIGVGMCACVCDGKRQCGC